MYVTAVDPNTTLKVMLEEVRRLGREPVDTSDLTGTRASFLTEFLMRSELAEGQANLLADFQLQTGDWRNARRFPERVRAVSATDIQTYARKIHHLQTVILGDPSKLDPKLFF
jgi:predicted Zn-dependent peptidase